MKKRVYPVTCLTCLAAIICLVATIKPSIAKGTFQKTSEKSESLKVSAENLTGAPLKLIVNNVNSIDSMKPEVTYSLINTSQKIIRAYAIRQDFTTANSKFTASDCLVIRSSNSFLQPGQTTPGSIGNSGSNEPITSITLTVDVVEFDDGEFWGKNTTNSRDLIDGKHYGIKKAVDFYQQKRKQALLEGMATGLEQDVVIALPTPENKSKEWIKGYKSGVTSVQARLSQAYKKYGIDELGHELNRASSEIERK
jgi:hypothetical protein